MKLKDYLKKFEGMDGELIVVYSRDDEGNGFQEVCYDPSEGWFDLEDKDFISKGQIDGYGDLEINAVCIN